MLSFRKYLPNFAPFWRIYNIFAERNKTNMANKQLNRIKVVLADKQRTNKWLAEQLGKDKTTVSKWCTNSSQPDLESLMKTAKLLGVEVAELLRNENVE